MAEMGIPREKLRGGEGGPRLIAGEGGRESRREIVGLQLYDPKRVLKSWGKVLNGSKGLTRSCVIVHMVVVLSVRFLRQYPSVLTCTQKREEMERQYCFRKRETAVLNYWNGLHLFLFSSLSCFFLLRCLLLRLKGFFFFESLQLILELSCFYTLNYLVVSYQRRGDY